MNNISIIIPTRNEEKYLFTCINSIINGLYPKDKIEIIIVDGLSDDSTIEIVNNLSKNNENIKLITNYSKTTPYALNLGIENSTGEYIFIVSAHAEYPEDYFFKLVEWANKLNADCVGGVLKTKTLKKTKTANAIQFVLSNKWGVGNAIFRTGVENVFEVDTVAFGCYHRSVFDKYGKFNQYLIRNQDIEFNLRIKKSGGTIFIVPDVSAIYYARSTFREFAKNNFQNGLWNILTVYYTKKINSLSFRHFVPLGFVLSILLPLVFSLYYFPLFFFSIGLLIIYIIFISNIILFKKIRNSNYHNIIFAFFILHFSYCIGSLIGILRMIKLVLK